MGPFVLRWVEGPREIGCAYHKKAVFRIPAASGQVDVFVMPKMRSSRPIAITVHLTVAGKRKPRVQEALWTTSEAAFIHDRFVRELLKRGMNERTSNDLSADVAELIAKDAAAIDKALSVKVP